MFSWGVGCICMSFKDAMLAAAHNDEYLYLNLPRYFVYERRWWGLSTKCEKIAIYGGNGDFYTRAAPTYTIISLL